MCASVKVRKGHITLKVIQICVLSSSLLRLRSLTGCLPRCGMGMEDIPLSLNYFQLLRSTGYKSLPLIIRVSISRDLLPDPPDSTNKDFPSLIPLTGKLRLG